MTANHAYTTDEIAQRLGIDKDGAYNFVRACIAMGVCAQNGTRPPPGGKGKGTNLYTFREDAPTVLWNKIHSL